MAVTTTARDHQDDTIRRPSHAHREVAREAGLGPLSPLSVLSGSLTAYGAFAVVAAIAGAALAAGDVDFDFSTDDWAGEELAGGIVTALVLLVAYLFGGYVAGRMARRSGLLHGAAVFAFSLVVGAAAGALVGGLADDADVEQNLRSIGVPTTWDDWSAVGVTAAVLALAGMLVGSLVGGVLGERWHTRLVRRAADPEIGPAADARRRAEQEDARREDRIAGDPVIAHDRDAVDLRDGHEQAMAPRDADEPPSADDTYVSPKPF